MGAFLENPMFLFVDDAEPILPIFGSTGPSLRPGDIGRIVELADVGCDTEPTFPVHFPCGVSDRRRGGAENLGSARRNAKWPGGRPPNEFARRAIDVNNNEVRNRSHVRRKGRRDDYDDVYVDVADLDYDDLFAGSPYDVLALSTNDSADEDEEEEEEYARFVDPRSTVAARSRTRERMPRYDYSGDPASSFTQSIRALERERSTSPRWFVEDDEENSREMRGTNVRPSVRRKRTKVLSRANGGFDREAEFAGKTRATAVRRESDGPPDAAPATNFFWDFIPFESDAGRGGAAFREPTRTRNPGGLQKTAPPGRRRSYIFDSQPKRAVDSDGEEEFKGTPRKDHRDNLSHEMNSARYRASKGEGAAKEKSKILGLTSNLVTSSRGRSMKASIDERISNMYPAEKDSVNMRPHLATEGRKIKSPTIDRKEEVTIATRMTVDDRRYHNKFNKLSNNSPKETGRATRTFNRVADSKNNGRIYVANKRDDANPHRGNSEDTKIDRINVAASRLAPEKKITKNERAPRTTGASAPRTDLEKEKERKFSSRLPIRIWKRLRTKEPAALRPKNDDEDVDRKHQGVENEKSDDHSVRVEKNDDVRVKDRAAASRNDVKRMFQNRIGPDKPRSRS